MSEVTFTPTVNGLMLNIDGVEVKELYAEDVYCALFDHEEVFAKNESVSIQSREDLLHGINTCIKDFMPSWEKTRDKDW
tara:strand:+ start:587 stop:823 length:237 start_codon:yes stop_codon:yes gene_type:complete